MFSVEVTYAAQDYEKVIRVELPEGSTVLDALRSSNIIDVCPEILKEESDIYALEGRVGIFGKVVLLSSIIKADDRIEIYRFLLQDPMETRRAKATEEIKKVKADHKALKGKRNKLGLLTGNRSSTLTPLLPMN